MTSLLDTIKTQAASLSSAERAELAHFLIASLDGLADEDAEAAWNNELARRAADITSGAATGKPAEQVFTELRKRHS